MKATRKPVKAWAVMQDNAIIGAFSPAIFWAHFDAEQFLKRPEISETLRIAEVLITELRPAKKKGK